MKNANVFVDVDLTLVDANQKLLPGAPEALARVGGENYSEAHRLILK